MRRYLDRMMSDNEKELKKAIEERDAARRHVDRLKRQLAGAFSLLALHGVDLDKFNE